MIREDVVEMFPPSLVMTCVLDPHDTPLLGSAEETYNSSL